MKFKLNYETTILGGLVGTLSQTNEDLCYKYNYLYNKVNSYNAIPENIDIELFYHTLDEVICFFQYNDYIAQDLRSRAKTMIDLNQKINELALRTELSMRAYIKESIE